MDKSIDSGLVIQKFIEEQIQNMAKGQTDDIDTNLLLSALTEQFNQSDTLDSELNQEISSSSLATMPEIGAFSFNDLPYEFSKLQEAAGREYFRCIGCRQRRDYLKKIGNPVPLLGSIVYLQASKKLIGDPQAPGSYPHICEGKFMCTTRRPSDRPRVLHEDAILSNFNADSLLNTTVSEKNFSNLQRPFMPNSPKSNIPVMTLAEAKSRMSSVPRISIPSEKYPNHTYIFQRLQHIYKATPPYTYFNCLSCKRLCAKWQNTPKKKHYIPKLRLSENGEILPWGTADRPHNGPHYCMGEEIPPDNDEITSEQKCAMDIVKQVVENLQSSSDQESIVMRNRKPSNASVASSQQSFRHNGFESPNSTLDANFIESNELSLQRQINEIRNILAMMQKTQVQVGLNKSQQQKINIVLSKSSFSKNIEIDCKESSIKEWYPHADVKIPVVERTNPDTDLTSEDRRLKKNTLEIQLNEIDRLLITTNENFALLLVDSLLIGLNEKSLKNVSVMRAEFPIMPSLVKTVFQSAFLKPNNCIKNKISTIFYALGYDMVRCYNQDSARGIGKTLCSEIDDLLDMIENECLEPVIKKEKMDNMNKFTDKKFVFITIPEMGFIRERLEAFNETIREKMNQLQKSRLYSHVSIELLDWAKLVATAPTCEVDSVDGRLNVLLREIVNKYSAKILFR